MILDGKQVSGKKLIEEYNKGDSKVKEALERLLSELSTLVEISKTPIQRVLDIIGEFKYPTYGGIVFREVNEEKIELTFPVANDDWTFKLFDYVKLFVKTGKNLGYNCYTTHYPKDNRKMGIICEQC